MTNNRFFLSELEGVQVSTDATDLIQNAIDTARKAGGGVVEIPAGTFSVRGLTLRSHVGIKGASDSATTLKLADNCNRNVIETEGFAKNIHQNSLWHVDDGMPYGFTVKEILIHGNRENNKSGHGLAIYGKRYALENVTIVECANDGLFSQGPDRGGQLHYNDIPETTIKTIRVHYCNDNGITYRGPHDGYIESAIIGLCGGKGLICETKTGVFNGAVDIGRVHAYACRVGIIIGTSGTRVSNLVADTNFKQGLVIDAHRVQVAQLWAFRNWRTDKGHELRSTDPRNDASVEIKQACQIGTATVRTDFGGTGIRVDGYRTQIGSCQIENESTAGGKLPAIGLDVNANLVRASGDIRGYSQPGSIGLRACGTKPLLMTTLDFTIVDCETGFMDGHGGDTHDWRIKIQTGPHQKGFIHSGVTKRSAIQLMSRGKDFRTHFQSPVEPNITPPAEEPPDREQS